MNTRRYPPAVRRKLKRAQRKLMKHFNRGDHIFGRACGQYLHMTWRRALDVMPARAAERMTVMDSRTFLSPMQRIQMSLAKIGSEHEPPNGWQTRVLASTVDKPNGESN